MSNWHIFGGIVQNATSSTPLRSAGRTPLPTLHNTRIPQYRNIYDIYDRIGYDMV